ncbi:hypothetical protein [Photobacterium sanguinicancri]|uniref:hypothetical protein n=1 Tax=Photobacterium sanguinicancri TaxID=875932 RepID=UPI0007880D5C|nr:hypothetical protein [Photobacterium sanguinicancri]KXI22765.1 hypothetical protein AS132_12005 [Photobacterium sanguinicancri]
MNRAAVKIVHRLSGIIALLMITTFFTSSVVADLFGSYETITLVKQTILQWVAVLVLSMMVVGISGKKLYPAVPKGVLAVKAMRLKIAAFNGVVILIPAAYFLAAWSAEGLFDTRYWLLQVIELLAGATNATMISLNIRDGVRLGKKPRK